MVFSDLRNDTPLEWNTRRGTVSGKWGDRNTNPPNKNRDMTFYKQNSVKKYGPMSLTHGVASERAEYFNVHSSAGIHGPLAVYERRLTPFKRHTNARLYPKSSWRVPASFVPAASSGFLCFNLYTKRLLFKCERLLEPLIRRNGPFLYRFNSLHPVFSGSGRN